MDINNLKNVKLDEVYIAEKTVTDSPGFSFDIGSSLTKIAYRSKEDFCDGKPINDKAIKDGRARLHLVSMPNEYGAKVLCDFIKESCDVTKAGTTGKRVKVIVTGAGNNLLKKELESELGKPLNLELSVVMEDRCFGEGFQVLKESLHPEEFSYPVDQEGIKGAEGYADVIGAWHGASGNSAVDMYSKLTYLNNPRPEGVKPYLPCIVVMCGSGSLVTMITEKGEYVALDGINLGGRTFLGFAEYMLGKKSFEDLMSEMESADGSTVDSRFCDGMDPDSDDAYSKIGQNTKRVFAMGKIVKTKNKDSIKTIDMVYSQFVTVCEYLAQTSWTTALYTGSRHIYFTGSFINIPLARRLITIEIEGRNLARPKNQHVGFSFLRQGGHCGALGAFSKGTKPEYQ